MASPLNKIRADLKLLRNPEKAKILSRFFKTGKGEYGEGDIFLGITVPEQRRIAKKYQDTTFDDLHELIAGRIHEHRLVALLILIEKYSKADISNKKSCVEFYIGHIPHINNWDLIDISAGKILGDFLMDKDKSLLYRLAHSENLWERRIAMMATFAFIRNNRYEDALKIAEILLQDSHDLIHKAVGWMLREIGKRDQPAEEEFLRKHYKVMPRTMLRYAIERFDENKRQFYMQKKTTRSR
ncbi:MAG: DNA alkylation repair protein [Thermodesulfovibrionales bacterium]